MLAALTMALPRFAHAYVDPGTGSMIWQVAAAAIIGCMFYVKRVAAWIRNRSRLRSQRVTGFLFACAFALIASPITATLFHDHPFPRFNDLFLVGIVLTAYLFTWEGSAFLLLIALLVSAWVLPPAGSMRIESFADWYRLASFGLLSVFLICLITRMKARQTAESAESLSEQRAVPMHGIVASAE